ncbi:histidine kinase, partial [Fibrella sp. HMF5405]|nr:histidine kinase [Fibrella forsythiae]
MRLLSSGRILQLLCFSLALAFRQRQLAVSQAIEQTQQTAQLVQGQLENELIVQRLEQEKIQVQLRALQAQVNPHFLFNSLNTLSFLIGSDPERAEVFLDELCKVYRYVLRANEQEMTDLQSELQFIRSYYHLLKTRYGDSLHLTIDVPPLYESYLLPTLTLQLLLENAVKHNVIAKTRPLY